jgi:hypothetical protein
MGDRITKLRGDELQVTPVMLAQAFWLLRRYSSATYIQRMHDLFVFFVERWERHARKSRRDGHIYRDIFKELYHYQAALERGVEKLRNGDASGLRDVDAGTTLWKALDPVANRRFDGGVFIDEIGYRPWPGPSVGLFLWGQRSARMAVRIERTLRTKWTFERMAEEVAKSELPATLAPMPEPQAEVITSGAEVPRFGIWIPIDAPGASPNYLLQASRAPDALVATERLDGDPVDDGKRPYLYFTYTPRRTRWQLVWEDTRYGAGPPPYEQHYLDASTALPPDEPPP